MATGFDDYGTSGNWTGDRLGATNTTWTHATAELTASGNSVEGISLNAIDSDANRDEIDVLVKIEVLTSLAAIATYVAFVRGQSGPYAYIVRMGGGFFRTFLHNNSASYTQISTVTTSNFDATGLYWIRLQATGTTVRARIWKDGTSEPGTWTSNTTDNAGVTGTNSVVAGVGWAGVQASTSNTGSAIKWVNGFGYGTNGDTAPNSAISTSASIAFSRAFPSAILNF